LVNHREIKSEVQNLVNELADKINFSFVGISGSADGFTIYDDCDMHVGFRVHAHIYNLSIRNYSILISEDERGRGVSQTLGLENIDIERPSYREKHLFGDFYLTKYDNNSDIGNAVVKHIDDYLEMTESMNYDNYKEAFHRMTCYFITMAEHFNLIDEYLTRDKSL
jgi:polysaccharide pyruvyl transferase WcaK-like protein